MREANEKEIKELKLITSNLEGKIIEALAQNEQNLHSRLVEFEKLENDNRERLFSNVKSLNDDARDDINKIASDIDSKVVTSKHEQELTNISIFNKIEQLSKDLVNNENAHKKQTHSWRNAAEMRFDEVLKLVKESVAQLREYRQKNDKEKSIYEKGLKEISTQLKIEQGMRAEIEHMLKREVSNIKAEASGNLLKFSSNNEEKYKHQARRISEEGKAVKYLQEKVDSTNKELSEKIKIESINREENFSKYDQAFVEVKETIEAIQWILTETMRITSDQQILSKRQQLRMRMLEKQQIAMTTDAEKSEDEGGLVDRRMMHPNSAGPFQNGQIQSTNQNLSYRPTTNARQSTRFDGFTTAESHDFSRAKSNLQDAIGNIYENDGLDPSMKLTKEEKKILKKVLKEKSTVSKALKIGKKKK